MDEKPSSRSSLKKLSGFSRRRFFAISAGVIAAPAILRRPALAEAKPVRVAIPTAGSAGTIWRPLVDQHKPADLNIEWIGATPGQGQIQVVAGTVDVAFYGPVGISQIISRGGDIVIFGPALNNHVRWIVKADSPYKTPHDLVGKKIATLAESAEAFLQSRMAAATIGLDLKKDFEVIHGPPPTNVALFQRGDVEAVVVLEPTATRLVGGGARQIATVDDIWRQGTGDKTSLFLVGFAAKREWLEGNRETAASLVDVFRKGYEDIHKQPARLSDLHGVMGIPATEKGAIELLPRTVDIYSTAWGADVFNNIDKQIEFALKVGSIREKPAKPFYVSL